MVFNTESDERLKSPKGEDSERDSRHRLEGQPLGTVVRNLIESRDPVHVVFRYALVAIGVVSGVRWLIVAWMSLAPALVTRKDFLQDYLMGKAVLHGMNPYLPTSDLAQHFLGKTEHLVFAHPCPHPPAVALTMALFAPFDYQGAATIWLLVEIAIITGIVLSLTQQVPSRWGWTKHALTPIVAFAWYPFGQELVVGQLTAPLMLLLVLAWRSLRRRSDLGAGIFLGLSVSMKLFTWPILVFFLIGKRWRVASGGLAAVILVNLVVVSVLGFQPVVHYFREVTPTAFEMYKSSEQNFSFWTIGWRLFDGTGSPVLNDMEADPLFYAPHLAATASLIAVTLILVLGLWLALRTRSTDASLGILICLAIVISPIAWSHYLTLAALPAAVAVRQCLQRQLPSTVTISVLCCCVVLFIPYEEIRARLLPGNLDLGRDYLVPFAFTLPVFLPVLGLSLLSATLWRLDRTHETGSIASRCR